MLTSYLVRCPHSDCGWFGSLLPRTNREAWRGPAPVTNVVEFQCPSCKATWQARLIGEDVFPITFAEPALF